jgi:hypothetical protein
MPLVAYTDKGAIIASAGSPSTLKTAVDRVSPGVKYYMCTREAIVNQGENDIGWLD